MKAAEADRITNTKLQLVKIDIIVLLGILLGLEKMITHLGKEDIMIL